MQFSNQSPLIEGKSSIHIQSSIIESLSVTSLNNDNIIYDERNNRGLLRKSPVDNLQSYINNIKQKKDSKTRNSYMNCSSSYNNIPKGSLSFPKRCNTSLKEDNSMSFINSLDEVKNFSRDVEENQLKKGSKHNENISFTSQNLSQKMEEKYDTNKNSTFTDIESEIGKDQTPVKAKIVNLQSRTKEKNTMIKDAFQSISNCNNTRNTFNQDSLIESRTFDYRSKNNQNNKFLNLKKLSDDFSEDADINDSFCNEEAVISKKINSSNINIKRNNI